MDPDLDPLFFSSYEDALSSCPNDAYQGQDLVDVVIEKNRIVRDQLKVNPTLELSSFRTLAGLAFASSNNLKVLDFGGGGGYHYSLARLVLPPESTISWAVVETPAMAKSAKALENGELVFFDQIDEAVHHLEQGFHKGFPTE